MEQNQNKTSRPLLHHEGNNGKAVLILHGFAANIEQTDILFDYFKAKGYSVVRPILPGHDGDLASMLRHGPADWLNAAREHLDRLSSEYGQVYLLGTSFGGNLALRLAQEKGDGIKAVIGLELPLFFNLKIWFLLNFLQPLLQWLRVPYVRKDGPLYRKNHVKRPGSFNCIPVRAAGEVRRFIRRHSFDDLVGIRHPLFLLHARKSDLLDNERGLAFIKRCLNPEQCQVLSVPIDNHDLDLLDEPGKMLMLERIHQFMEGA